MDSIPSPQDTFFREHFTRREFACDFLGHHLPPALRYFVQGTQRIGEPTAHHLLQAIPSGDPTMQTFIDRYIEQGRKSGILEGQRLGEATALLRIIERTFGPPSDSVRERVLAADSDTLLRWLDRILVAESVDAVFH